MQCLCPASHGDNVTMHVTSVYRTPVSIKPWGCTHITLLSHRSRQRWCSPSVCPFVRLSVCRQMRNAKTRFSIKKLSNLELWCLLTTYRKSYIGFSKNSLSDLWNSRWRRSAILKIDMTSFFCRGRSHVDEIWLGCCRMTCRLGGMVEIETGSIIPVWRPVVFPKQK